MWCLFELLAIWHFCKGIIQEKNSVAFGLFIINYYCQQKHFFARTLHSITGDRRQLFRDSAFSRGRAQTALKLYLLIYSMSIPRTASRSISHKPTNAQAFIDHTVLY